ncbi:vesicle transport protein GOT1A isoform X1 [Mixophyes fleayi]|uniref:vesicle transport protein GOT1A isoform X1 n=1 Tax=Mixophyes fleayi TaxID=3061075 RepID=UPI003F4D732A
MISELQKLGAGLAGFGVFFLIFGVLLYFDSVLLAFGNILFLSGLTLIIGLRRTFSFFFQRQKLRGSSFFLGGAVLVLLRWPLIGMLCEFYGFISLFSFFRAWREVTRPWFNLNKTTASNNKLSVHIEANKLPSILKAVSTHM